MLDEMPEVYMGDKPYIFVSYAHADEAALQIIDELVVAGYRVWYDDGVEPSVRYSDYLADHVCGCACFMPLISRASIDSEWCRAETEYALDQKKKVLPVYLEDVELPRGLQLRMGNKQALYWYKSADEFYRKLFKARRLEDCLTGEGKRSRGVKAREAKTKEQMEQEAADKSRHAVPSVEPKGSLNDYTWAELKQISRAIAAAGEDEWLEMAKRYRLVDAKGELQGAEKYFELVGGTKASVRILGFRHDELAGDKGVAGISFEFANVPAVHRMNSDWTNVGGWKGSEMREWLNDASGGFLALLPEDLRQHVAAARKRTNNRGRVPENDTSAVTETNDALWLLSMSEVYGGLSAQKQNVPPSPATYDAEGSQYQLYANKEVSTVNYGPCQKRGAGSWWWLRSPSADGSGAFLVVVSVGVWSDWGAIVGGGVSPGFCF